MKQPFSHTLEITAENQPTVLERLLQVTRYRGFSVTTFSVFPSENETLLDIKLAVHNGKTSIDSQQCSVKKLYHQLNKLFDIRHVDLKPAVAGNIECGAVKFDSSEITHLVSNVN